MGERQKHVKVAKAAKWLESHHLLDTPQRANSKNYDGSG
jgi:hypothetical protein